MVEFITTDGITVDLIPNQDVAITIENAFFSSDRIPVAWTTDIEMPASETNCRLFGFPNSMLLPAARKQINVEMRINSIPVMIGNLKLLGPSNGLLRVSFAGIAIEDSLTGSLKDASFNKFEFPLIFFNEADEAYYNEIMTGAANGTRDDFATPLMIRESEKDQPDIFIDMTSEGTKLHYATKFLNSPIGNYTIPVVRLKYILQTVFSDCAIDAAFATYIDKIGIVAPYRKNGTISASNCQTGCLDTIFDNGYLRSILDLAEAMPDMTIVDFIKNVLKAFGATIFITNEEKRMISNKSIIQNQTFEDWSDKIDDNIEQEYETGQGYDYGFPSVQNTEIKGSFTACKSLKECFSIDLGVIVFCEETQDYYQVIEKEIRVGLSNGESWGRVMKCLSYLKQGGMISEDSSNKTSDMVSGTCDFTPVKSWPCHFYSPMGWLILGTTAIMTPIVDMPLVGGNRPTDIYFGTLEIPADAEASINPFAHNVQFTSNGSFGTAGMFISSFLPGTTPLTMQGDRGLYEKFHKDYKEWLAKDKDISRVTVNLSAKDIANLKIWKKIMLYNQLFFIQTLTITLNTSKDEIFTEVDLVTA